MQFSRGMLAAVLGGLLVVAGPARAETKVEVKNVHLCCGACVKAVGEILNKVDGVKGKCDRQSRTITITAPDDATAQKALDALAAGGFHGDTGNKSLAMKDDAAAPSGKVKEVTVSGVHNCCQSCCRAIKETVKKVNGVTGDTAKPKAATFEVTGDFDAGELVKALHDAGFHAKVEKK